MTLSVPSWPPPGGTDVSHNLSLGGYCARLIENRSHSVRNVTMGEDASRIRTKSGPPVMAAMRNATIGFLRFTGATNIAEAIRRNALRVGEHFTKLGILKQ